MKPWNTWSPSATWPTATYESMPRGYRYVTLRRCPVPFINVKHKGSGEIIRLWVGEPLPLDPQAMYQCNAIARSDIDLATDPGAGVATHTFLDRTIELLFSDHPIPGGQIVLAVTVTKVQAAALVMNNYLRLTSERARAVIVNSRANGTITAAGIYQYDPDGITWSTQYAPKYSAGALAANQKVFGSVNRSAVDPSDGTLMLHGSPGITLYTSFPVTTTPSVEFRVVMELART